MYLTKIQLLKRLQSIEVHIRNAVDDAPEDFALATDHAAIALQELKDLIPEARRSPAYRE